jgi:hypothetical protein
MRTSSARWVVEPLHLRVHLRRTTPRPLPLICPNHRRGEPGSPHERLQSAEPEPLALVSPQTRVFAAASRRLPLDIRVGLPAARSRPADRHAANAIREVRKAGANTLRDMAEALNARGVSTPRGGRWFATSVRNVLARA